MAKLFTRNGKILTKNGQVITGEVCCCDDRMSFCCIEDQSSGESSCSEMTSQACIVAGGTPFTTAEACAANCGTGYICESNRNCKPVPMSDAEFQTLEECEGQCGCCCFEREGIIFGDFTGQNSGTTQGSSASFTNIIGTSSASFSADLPDPFCPEDSGSFTATINYSYSSLQPAIDGSLAQIFLNVVGQPNSTQFVDGLPPSGSHTFNFDASPCGTITINVGFTDFQEEATGELIESPSHSYFYERVMSFDACESS